MLKALRRLKISVLLVAMLLAAAQACSRRQSLKTGIDDVGMDKSVAPGDDFNAYTNGGWIRSTPIPNDKAFYGTGTVLYDETQNRLRFLMQDPARLATTVHSDLRKVGEFYASFMDEAAIESKGITPLQPQLDAFSAIADRHGLARALGSQLRADVDPLNNTKFDTSNLFGVWITEGLKDPSRNYPYLLQGGLGMPDRDYYLSPSPQMDQLRKQYRAHIETMFKLACFSDSGRRAAGVFALETAIAKVHATRVESEDVRSPILWKREDLPSKAPGLDWGTLLEAAGLKDAAVFVVWHPKAVTGVSALALSEPLDAWKDWLALHALEHHANYLPKAFVDEWFNFYGKALRGTPELRPRWQRGVDATSQALGDAVGKAYVEHYFPAENRARVDTMVADLVKAFAKRIDTLAWMSTETKAKAKQKLATLKVGVGYPDHWRDYSGLEIIKGDALGNAQRAELFEYRYQLRKLHRPVDRSEWWMTPQTVDAVNLPLQNALNFPAAVIQSPFFDINAEVAHNYGSIGMIIGHEISHSFDDQGSQFDDEGRLANWWTKSDFDHFRTAGQALAAQFDTYHPFPDRALNGQQTLSENIADVAGLLAAYEAYHLSLHGKPDTIKGGLTGDQRFFISFGQTFRWKMRDAELRRQIATDAHAPAQYRVETVRNLDAWYTAFSVQPSNKLFLAPNIRVRVW